MSLAHIVELYRVCERPPLDGDHFACTTAFPLVKALVKKIREDPSTRFDDIEIDGVDVLDDPLPEIGEKISFRLKLPTGSSARFHNDLASLLDIDPRISRGATPPEYYLVKDNYYSGDSDSPEHVYALERICRLIIGLSGLAHYHDEKPSSGYLRLVFIQPTKGAGIKPVELETRVTTSIIQASADLEPRLVEELSESSAANDPHHSAKAGVFGTSLATFVGSRPAGDAFEYLVTNWRNFVTEYQRDLSTYLSGFAFHKAKAEVAEAELKIANEFSKIVSDITGKLLGIPISIAAIIAIPKAETLFDRMLFILGIAIASFVIYRTVLNQKRQFNRIKNAKDIVIGAIEGKKDSYPRDLADVVDKLSLDLTNDERGLHNNLLIFGILSWLPLAIALFVMCHLYWADIVHFTSYFHRQD